MLAAEEGNGRSDVWSISWATGFRDLLSKDGMFFRLWSRESLLQALSS